MAVPIHSTRRANPIRDPNPIRRANEVQHPNLRRHANVDCHASHRAILRHYANVSSATCA
jgi:hypothetical protein